MSKHFHRTLVLFLTVIFGFSPIVTASSSELNAESNLSIVRCSPLGAPDLLQGGAKAVLGKLDWELQCRRTSQGFFGPKKVNGIVGVVRVEGESYGSGVGDAHMHIGHRKLTINPKSTKISGLSNGEQKALDRAAELKRGIAKALSYAGLSPGPWKAKIE